MMEAGSAEDYSKGLLYLSAARKVSIASRGLDGQHADILRKQADVLTAEGLKLLRRAVRPARNNASAAG